MTSHDKNFLSWISQKELIHTKNKSVYVHARDVWWASVGVNIGTEIDGKNDRFERPVLVLRPLGREQFIGIPLTSKLKQGVFYKSVTYQGATGVACLSQLRVFSTKRVLRKIARVDTKSFKDIQAKLVELISNERMQS